MPQTLAQAIKAKYPDYKDVPDTDLEDKWIAKYPDYKDAPRTAKTQPVPNVSTPKVESAKEPSTFDKVMTKIGDFTGRKYSPPSSFGEVIDRISSPLAPEINAPEHYGRFDIPDAPTAYNNIVRPMTSSLGLASIATEGAAGLLAKYKGNSQPKPVEPRSSAEATVQDIVNTRNSPIVNTIDNPASLPYSGPSKALDNAKSVGSNYGLQNVNPVKPRVGMGIDGVPKLLNPNAETLKAVGKAGYIPKIETDKSISLKKVQSISSPVQKVEPIKSIQAPPNEPPVPPETLQAPESIPPKKSPLIYSKDLKASNKQAIFDWTNEQSASRFKSKNVDTLTDLPTEYKAATDKLYTYLKDTAQIELPKTKSDKVPPMNRWKITGPDAENITSFINNIKGKSPEALKNTADIVSYTKNIYLGGGIPTTPLNIHGYNIARSDFAARGVVKSLGNFFNGTFKPGEEKQYLKDNIGKLPDLIAKGYEPGMEGHGPTGQAHVPLEEWLNKNKVGEVAVKGVKFSQKIFEDPLFKVHLPATKLRFTLDRIDELINKGMAKEEATRKAVNDANVFYGGINKSLRNKTYNDLARIGALAPDWLESRMRLGGRKISSTAKVIAGKGDITDPLYAKAMGRTLASDVLTKGGGLLAGKTAYDYLRDRPSSVTTLPVGQSGKKERSIPIQGTSAEELRMPEEIGLAFKQGNPGAIFEAIKNRMSQPASSATNIIKNSDPFGNPLYGKDRYGKPISTLKGIENVGGEAIKPFEPQFMQALISLLEGKIGKEEAASQALELPLRYVNPMKHGKSR